MDSCLEQIVETISWVIVFRSGRVFSIAVLSGLNTLFDNACNFITQLRKFEQEKRKGRKRD
jgi:hypothetical protein